MIDLWQLTKDVASFRTMCMEQSQNEPCKCDGVCTSAKAYKHACNMNWYKLFCIESYNNVPWRNGKEWDGDFASCPFRVISVQNGTTIYKKGLEMPLGPCTNFDDLLDRPLIERFAMEIFAPYDEEKAINDALKGIERCAALIQILEEEGLKSC